MGSLQTLLEKLTDQWSDIITLKRNEFLTQKGEVHPYLYFVNAGSLRVYIEDKDEEHTIRFGYQNSIVSPLDSFLSGNPTLYYIQALKNCELKVISREEFLNFINSEEEYKILWNTFLQDVVYQQLEREIDLITFTPHKRFERLFKRSPHLFQEVPHKYIASYLRMKPETLSRILKNIDFNHLF